MPLYHFVTADLPSNTKAPELADANAAKALKADAAWSGTDASAGAGVTEELVGLYASYLSAVGFLPRPTESESESEGGKDKDKEVRPLPRVEISQGQREAMAGVGGRGGAA